MYAPATMSSTPRIPYTPGDSLSIIGESNNRNTGVNDMNGTLSETSEFFIARI